MANYSKFKFTLLMGCQDEYESFLQAFNASCGMPESGDFSAGCSAWKKRLRKFTRKYPFLLLQLDLFGDKPGKCLRLYSCQGNVWDGMTSHPNPDLIKNLRVLLSCRSWTDDRHLELPGGEAYFDAAANVTYVKMGSTLLVALCGDKRDAISKRITKMIRNGVSHSELTSQLVSWALSLSVLLPDACRLGDKTSGLALAGRTKENVGTKVFLVKSEWRERCDNMVIVKVFFDIQSARHAIVSEILDAEKLRGAKYQYWQSDPAATMERKDMEFEKCSSLSPMNSCFDTEHFPFTKVKVYDLNDGVTDPDLSESFIAYEIHEGTLNCDTLDMNL